MDVSHDSEKIIIEAEIPGINKDQLSVEVDGDWLKIRGDKKVKTEDKSRNYIHRELKNSAFCRSFRLPQSVNKEKFTAEFTNGILSIILPKKITESPPNNVKRIDIK